MVWINPAWNCKMVVKRLTTFFLKSYYYYFFGRGRGRVSLTVQVPHCDCLKICKHLSLGRIRKRRRCNLLLTSTLDLKRRNEGMQPWLRYVVISINLSFVDVLGWWANIVKWSGKWWYPSNGILNNQPHVHLIRWAFIGSQSHFKDMRKQELLFSAPFMWFVQPPEARNDFQFEDILVSYHAGSPENQRLLANGWRIFHVFTRFQANSQWLVARFLNLQ